jgi:hypothetical protein
MGVGLAVFDGDKVEERLLHSPRVGFQDSCVEGDKPQSRGDCPDVERESPRIQGGIGTNCYAEPPHVPTCYWQQAIPLHGHVHPPPTDTMGVEGCLGSLSTGLHPLCSGRS